MNESRLMIVMGDKDWTLAAMHLACAMSRQGEVSVVLVDMVPVRHPQLLGTEAGWINFSADEAQVLQNISATAEDYGVYLDVQLFQYTNYWLGVVDAAAQLEATAVIIHIPHSSIPYWPDLRRGWLRRRLAGQRQLLFSLDDWTLAIFDSTSGGNSLNLTMVSRGRVNFRQSPVDDYTISQGRIPLDNLQNELAFLLEHRQS